MVRGDPSPSRGDGSSFPSRGDGSNLASPLRLLVGVQRRASATVTGNMRAAIGVVFLVVSAGCGGAAVRPADIDPGDPASPPAMEALPSVAGGEGLGEGMRLALSLARRSLEVAPPELPARTDATTLLRWTDAELTPWLERKMQVVEAARRKLDEVAEQAHVHRILAGALVGLMYEQVGDVVGSVPTPEDLAHEPEIAAVFQDVVHFRASQYVEQARSAYLACARNAIHPETMHHWSVFCAKRADALPPPRYVPTQEGTTVTVSVDY